MDVFHDEPRPGRQWISMGVVVAGLALVAVGGWPRRRGATIDPTTPPKES